MKYSSRKKTKKKQGKMEKHEQKRLKFREESKWCKSKLRKCVQVEKVNEQELAVGNRENIWCETTWGTFLILANITNTNYVTCTKKSVKSVERF